jgi:hypothetical protein
MTLSFGKSKFKLQKKFLAFFGIVPLLLATAFIQVPCPVCGGTGVVSSTGMAEVTLLNDPTFVLRTTWMVTCNTYRVYQMDVTLDLQNDGKEDANGFVSLFLIDVASGKTLDAENVIVTVSAGNIAEQTVLATFIVAAVDDPQQAVHIVAKVRDGNVACQACGGTGKVALNTWPLYNSIKGSFKQTEIYEIPLLPPLRVDVEGGTA